MCINSRRSSTRVASSPNNIVNPGYVSSSEIFAFGGTQRRNFDDEGIQKPTSNAYDALVDLGGYAGQYSELGSGYADATADIERDNYYLKPVDAGCGGGSVPDDNDGMRASVIDDNESAYCLTNKI